MVVAVNDTGLVGSQLGPMLGQQADRRQPQPARQLVPQQSHKEASMERCGEGGALSRAS